MTPQLQDAIKTISDFLKNAENEIRSFNQQKTILEARNTVLEEKNTGLTQENTNLEDQKQKLLVDVQALREEKDLLEPLINEFRNYETKSRKILETKEHSLIEREKILRKDEVMVRNQRSILPIS
jgi:chromosome segregation ATPase